MFYSANGLLLASVLASVFLFRRLAHWPAADRCMATLIPVSAAFLLIETAAGVLGAPYWIWNDVRLARGIAWAQGYKLYYDEHSGPVIGTMHAPLGYMLYASLAFLRSPTALLMAASVVSAILVFGPVAWIFLKTPWRGGETGREIGRESWMWRTFIFLGCALMLFRSSGVIYSAFKVHSDAAALGFAAAAAGVLRRMDKHRPLNAFLLSAALACLSVWSKQTLAPLLPALSLFVWMTDGFRQFAKYVLCLLGTGLTISLFLLAVLWPPAAMWFNTVVVPASQPYGKPEQLVRSLSLLASESLLPAAVVVFLVLYAVFFDEAVPRGFRSLLATNRWLIFTAVAVAMTPAFLAGSIKVGGDVNHISLIAYFVGISASAGLADRWTGERQRNQSLSNAVKILATLLILAGLARMPLTLFGLLDGRDSAANPTQEAYNYEKAHPGVAYFPLNPLAVLLASERLTHCDCALVDRELAGFGIGVEQFRQHVPKDFRIVAFPPGERPVSAILTAELRGFTETAGTGELAGWTVFQRSTLAETAAIQLRYAAAPRARSAH